MNHNFGSYPTMITPYAKDGAVDLDTAEKYVCFYAENGCAGIFAVCQSSEIFYLSLEERVALNKRVYDTVQRIGKETGKTMTVVSSGHTAETLPEQIEELNRIAESGTDALILITNRLDPHNEGDDVWIKNAEILLQHLPKELPLGLYECPYPYKRLVTPKILRWCLETDRFYFMKDTCCDIGMIRERLDILNGSHFALLNANCQTLLESMRLGGKGYCGIMANFHPKLYAWLCQNYKNDPKTAEFLQSVLGTFGFTEVGLPYPLTAKYSMTLRGIPTENLARNRDADALTAYAKDCVRQMNHATDLLEQKLRLTEAEK